MEKYYLIQMAYSGVDGNGINYHCLNAKNKKMAIQTVLKRSELSKYKCCLISIKRVSKSLVYAVENHNKQLTKRGVL